MKAVVLCRTLFSALTFYDIFISEKVVYYIVSKRKTERNVKMSVELNCKDGCLTAKLSGELDHHAAAEIRVKLDGELERTTPALLIFDFGKVSFMDSSGIGLILGRARLISSWGGKIIAVNTSDRIRKIITLSGLGSVIRQQL